ncbi:MAG: family 10 glycosylhydrolase [Tidjanibacter sp.]|nr:family 10 glycosylhydrolase [Tidjanibacter sp.]
MKITNLLTMLLAVGVVASATISCTEEEPYVPEWEWGNGGNPDDGKEDDKEDDKEDNKENGDDDNTTPVEPADLKPRYLWIDAAANFPDYANSRAQIAVDLKKVADTGFTDIVVDVRPTNGDVLFKTDVLPMITRLDYWGNGYQFFNRTESWDYLQAFIEEGHKVGLRVHAGVNTMVGGKLYPYGLGEDGMLFRDASRKEWAQVLNLPEGLTNMMDTDDDAYSTKFLNPAHPEVVEFLLEMLGDLAAYSELDGIFLDRCRYDCLAADFSDISRAAFEEYIGRKVENWPNDVLKPGQTPSYPSALQKQWLEFRAKTIHDFVEKAEQRVHSVRADIQFGAYVGGWYSSYYDVGVNWASPSFPTSSHYGWASVDYKDYGYADHLDFLLVGAYASATSIYGQSEWSVQGFCKTAAKVLMDDCPFAGGPDVGNWDTKGLSDVKLREAVTNTVDAAINEGDGYFCFDLIHIKMYNYWAPIKRGIDAYLKANE